MTLSIIIVNYHVKKELFDCINSIYESKSKLKFEIIVVDNDENKTIATDLEKRFPKVIYIESNKNLGYGAGNNLGIKSAKGEYLFILNPDTRIISGNIASLVDILKNNNKIGAVAPLLLDKEGIPFEFQGTLKLTPKRSIFSLSILSKIFPWNRIYREYYIYGWNKNKLKQVDVVPGTAFLIRKSVFEKMGGFDERFFLYFEEFDLCKKLIESGFKNYISPEVKVFHEWGASTLKNINSEKVFQKSRFYYFKKNYGFIKAFILEIIFKINIGNIILIPILLLGLFLRVYELSVRMPFIGDVAWFYMSAKNFIHDGGSLPLVGITSSHIWLHQGAYWTYVLAVIFKLFGYNPVVPAFFTAIVGVITIIILYKFSKNLFSVRIALISAFFYATAPLIVQDARMPYHTSLIPTITLFLLISLYNWIVKGRLIFFPISLFFLAILYNFEIATFSVFGIILFFLAYGLIKKEKWVLGLFNKKIVVLTGICIFIPLIPFIIYDLSHGFPQTIKVMLWIMYRIAVFLGYPPLHPNIPAENWTTWSGFILSNIKKGIFLPSLAGAIAILLSALTFTGYKFFENRNIKNQRLTYLLFFISFIVPSVAYILAKTNSAAYLLVFYPQLAIMIGILFGNKFKNKYFRHLLICLIVFIGILNSIYIIESYKFLDKNLKYQTEQSKQIIIEAKGRPYNILGKGMWSQYEGFTMPHEYLTWWLGDGPSEKDEKIKFIFDSKTGIVYLR